MTAEPTAVQSIGSLSGRRPAGLWRRGSDSSAARLGSAPYLAAVICPVHVVEVGLSVPEFIELPFVRRVHRRECCVERAGPEAQLRGAERPRRPQLAVLGEPDRASEERGGCTDASTGLRS